MSDYELAISAKKGICKNQDHNGFRVLYDFENTVAYFDEKNRLHRIDGPAITSNIGNKWYIRNINITSWEQLQYEANLTNEEILMLALTYGEI